jgi:hypothetical protein
VLQEAVELVEVAEGNGEEGRRIGVLGPGDGADLELQLVAETLDAPGDAHEVALLEAPGVQVGVAEDARGDGAGAVAQLEREVGRPGAGGQAILARAREDAVDLVAGTHRRDRDGRCRNGVELCGGHEPMMYREPDAAPHMGASPRRPTGARARVRLHGVERRRRRRIGRPAVPRLVAGRHPLRAHRP